MKIRKKHKWPILKATLDQMFKYFCIVATVLLLINGGLAWVSGNDWILYNQDLLRLILSAFFAVLPLLLAVFFEEYSIKGLPVLRVIRFVITAILVLGTLIIIQPTGRDVTLLTGVIFLFVYVAIDGYGYVTSRRLVLNINKKLDALHREENATCTGKDETHSG